MIGATPNTSKRTPAQLLAVVVAAVFVTELLAMGVMHWLALSSPWVEALLDATLLTGVVFPVLYLVVFRPMVHEVAAHQRDAAALRESESRYRGLFTSSRDAIMTLEPPTWKFTSGNPASVAMFGARDAEHFATIGPWELSPEQQPDGRASGEKAKEMIETAMRDGSHFFEWTHRRINGESFPATVLLSRLETDGKAFLQATVRDITEAKRAQTQIESLHRHNEMILNSAGEGIYGVDFEGNTTLVNLAALKLLGYTREELIGKPQHALIHHTRPDGRLYPREECPIYAAFTDGRVHYVTDEVFWRKDGTSFPVEYFSNPMHDERGALIGAVTTFNDITERKRAEEALQAKNEELERFTYAVSHDLRSPLVTIQTFLGHLEEDMATADAGRIAKDVNFIHTAANKMEELLKELRELSRVGRQMNPPEDVPLQTLVREVLKLVAGRISQRGAQMVVTETPAMLHGDRARLVAVFQNLVDNACKFMGDQKEPRIEIGVETRGAAPVLFVRDNGGGIEPQNLGKLFGLFVRLRPTIEGTGLGLPLVKRIIETHGGRIWVESAGLGQGACFYFTLPGAVNKTNEGE